MASTSDAGLRQQSMRIWRGNGASFFRARQPIMSLDRAPEDHINTNNILFLVFLLVSGHGARM